MTIRVAKLEDSNAIIDFQIAMALETENVNLDRTIITKGVIALLRDKSKGLYYLADDNGLTIGSMLTTYEWSDWRNGTILWLQSVYIKPDYRGKGIFRLMYNHLKEKVLNYSDSVGLRLYVDNTNTNAQNVYKAMGMNGDHYKTYEWIKD